MHNHFSQIFFLLYGVDYSKCNSHMLFLIQRKTQNKDVENF